MKKAIVLSPFIVLLCLSMHMQSADACSCVAPAAAEIALDESQAVFVGKVEKITKASQGKLSVEMSAERHFKGASDARITVTTNEFSASCGYRFEEGVRYLVYARGEKLQVGLCSRTKKADDASGEIARLDELAGKGSPKAKIPGSKISTSETVADPQNPEPADAEPESPEPQVTPAPHTVEPAQRGCGCSTGSSSSGTWLLGLLAFGALLRPRRRS